MPLAPLPPWIARALIGVATCLGASAALANDAVGAIALGGIELGSEPRVAMKKEWLYVSQKEVRVRYEFVNDSKEDVTTDVIFPIPECTGKEERCGHPGFTVSVNGKSVAAAKGVRAFFQGQDVTAILWHAGLDVLAWTDAGIEGKDALIRKLPNAARADLRKRGLLDHTEYEPPVDGRKDIDEPKWSVHPFYSWRQRFAAGKVVRVAHKYAPALGGTVDVREEQVPASCADASLAARLKRAMMKPGASGTIWVQYILTTASTWKMPIREFELTVERPPGQLVSFCWDGPVEKTGPNTFRAVMKNFEPRQELDIYYFNLPDVPAQDEGWQ